MLVKYICISPLDRFLNIYSYLDIWHNKFNHYVLITYFKNLLLNFQGEFFSKFTLGNFTCTV